MFTKVLLLLILGLINPACAFLEVTIEPDVVQLPYLKNSANECYYLDEFMPVPDSLVAGKYGRMALRYYTYKTASYKDWDEKQVILSFYSQDDRCWSLFEESYIVN